MKKIKSETTQSKYNGGENVESLEACSLAGEDGVISTLSTGEHSLRDAIFPAGSWLARYMDFARLREESADSYLLGSILPVVATALGRRVRFPWGEGWIYPNLFCMLAGKPGDRKSSAVNLAEKIARIVLDKRVFLPDNFSVEAMFEEYDDQCGGSPDKLLILDDANPFLGLVQKANYGERIGESLLRLFDCKGLDQAFLRNKENSGGMARRQIPETSTSIVLGATFNICQFQGQEIRSGLQRRFNYYLAEGHGRFLVVPAKSDPSAVDTVAEGLRKLAALPTVECSFTYDASQLWETFQLQNRREIQASTTRLDSQLSRLNGQPVHVIKMAMIFQAALWAESRIEPFEGLIEAATLQEAIEHSEHCISAAQALDGIGNRAAIESDADVLLANIRQDFRGRSSANAIVLTRTELTSKYAHHSGRKWAHRPDDLYLRLIPDLIRRDKAKEVPRPNKQSAFSFTVEEEI